jgi:ribosomal protein S18 acetylase RimI-like enzyme
MTLSKADQIFTMTGPSVPASHDARIRAAEPDDSAFLATAILQASRSHLPRGLWDLVVAAPQEQLDFLELLTLMNERSLCHYSNFFIAGEPQQPAAALAAYDPGDTGMLGAGHAIAVAWEEFGAANAELDAAYRRLEPYQSAVPEQRPGVWTIEWVWAEPSMRRRGLVAALLQHALDEGRRRGYALAQVTTYIGNRAAAMLYERSGFRVAEEKRRPEFERVMGAPGLVRYERALA